ncbi:MAG: ROK family protein [Chloroflexota bacterium]
MDNQVFIGIDIGGTNVDALLADAKGSEIAFTTNSIRQPSKRPVDIVIQTVLELMEETSEMPCAIGVGVPGLVDPKTGRVDLAVNLSEPSIDLGSILKHEFSLPVFVDNDANAYAMAAAKFLFDESVQNLAFITLGTGVGGGLVLNGEIYNGTKNMAGEIGHTYAGPNLVRCQCGLNGCLETFVAGPAIARIAKNAANSDRATSLKNVEVLDAAVVFRHAEAGDSVSQEIIDEMCGYLARATHMLMMSFDLQKIMIGGGLSRAGNALLNPIQKEWAKMACQSSMAAEMLKPDILELCPLDFRAGTWGAVAIAMNQMCITDSAQDFGVVENGSVRSDEMRPIIKTQI